MTRFLRTLVARRPCAWAAAGLTASFGLLLGYFLWYALFEATPHLYTLSWTARAEAPVGPPGSQTLGAPESASARLFQARWITHPGRPLLGYYRKTFWAPSRMQSAWIQIAAPFTFDLYINGRHIGADLYKSANVAALFDVSRYIQPGRNVIAIYNMSRTYEQHSELLVLGAAVDWEGRNHPFVTDGTWRCSDKYDRQIHRPGQPEWFDVEFDDHPWPFATVERDPVPGDRTREDFHPWALRSPIRSGWVWASDPLATESYFRREFTLSGRPSDSWIRLAARVSYTLLINGTAVMAQEKGIVQQPGIVNLDIYEITPFLRPGRNVLAIKVHNRFTKRGLLVDGFVSDRNGPQDIATALGDWRVSSEFQSGWETVGFRPEEPARWEAARRILTETPASQAEYFRRILVIDPPRGYFWGEWVKRGLFMLAVAAAVIAQAAFAGRAVARAVRARGEQPGLTDDEGWYLAAWPAALAGLVLAFLWLLGYDHRFDLSWPFRLRWALLGYGVFLLGLTAMVLHAMGRLRAPRLRPDFTGIPAGPRAALAWLRARWMPLTVGLLMVVGYQIRIQYLDFEPIGADEIKMLAKSVGVLNLGYPHVVISEHIPTRWTTTSELVHYPMALSVLFFGPTEFAVRLPGVLFSALTILLLYRYGSWVRDRRVGLLAAVLYTFLPSIIRMSQMARYPSQLQFFTLLTVYFFHRYFLQEPKGYRYLYWGSAAYIATYLSWEGSGFLVPALFVGLLCVRREDIGTWLRDRRLVLCLFIVTLVVALQLNIRMRVSGGLAIYGTGTSEISVMPMWNHSNFDALYYWNNYLRIENHQLMTYLAIAGLLFCLGSGRASRSLLYLNAVNATVVFMNTSFLQIRNWRYIYYLIPLLILTAALTLFLYLDLFSSLLRGETMRRLGAGWRRAAATAAVTILALCSTTYVVALYDLPGLHGLPRTRLEDRYYPTVKDAIDFLNRRLERDDVILSSIPHLVDYYLPDRKSDYFLETILQFQLFLDHIRIPASEGIRGSDAPQWVGMHRVSGTPTILSGEELRHLLASHRRVWYVTSPLDEKLLDNATYDFIREEFSVVYENIASTVYLRER